jgi:predicted AAA+ superfamily ATPase
MRSGKGRQAPHLNKNRESYCSKLQAARIELVAWGDQAANWNNDAIKMLIMTKTKDGPEFANDYSSAKVLERIAAALERLAGAQAGPCDFGAAEAFVFAAGTATLVPVPRVNRVDIGLLRGIDQARDTLLGNTERFAQGFAANNALLWGARGMGKSALIKAAHATINARLAASPDSKPLKLIEIHREDVGGLPRLMALLRGQSWRFLVFCDDLSFDAADSSYKSLKAALEGGIEGRPGNVLLYATSNRRHILTREMIENERGTAINPDDAVQEKISLRTASGFGSAFIPVRKTIILRWFSVTPSISVLLARAKKSSARRSNGLSRGARVPGGRPGNISRTSPADWARRWGDPVRSISRIVLR